MNKVFWKRNFLLFVVFATGAAVLVVEVVATRVLAPYFGNTIFSISSIISTILAALSFGYYFGGKLADKRPTLNLFFGIIFAAGISILLIHYLSVFLLPILGRVFSIIYGPLVSAIVLFFIPALFLGTLSPFAIKLQHKINPEVGIGTMSGKIFFWSTFGSIFGSLFSGFYLIPNFGLSNMLIVTGILLIIMSGIFLIFLNKKYKNIFFLILICVVLIGLQLPKDKVEALYIKEGMYHRIVVREGYNEDNQLVRVLNLDKSNSGWKFDNEENGMMDYAKYYKLIDLIKNPKEVLVIGGGAYIVPDLIIDNYKNINVDVVEIEPSLYDLSVEYFDLTESDRLTNYVADGRGFLNKSDKKYDLIFADAYSSVISIPTHLITEEFFILSKDSLNNDGMFWANIIGSLDSITVASEIKTFKKVFPNSYFFITEDHELDNLQNIVVVGVNSDEIIDFTNLDIIKVFQPLVSDISKNIFNMEILNKGGIILTDNYCPIDYLMKENFTKLP